MAERISAADVDRIITLRAQGLSLRSIGHELGHCYETIRQVVIRKAEIMAEEGDEDAALRLLGERGALPPRHRVVWKGLWRGLEQYAPELKSVGGDDGR